MSAVWRAARAAVRRRRLQTSTVAVVVALSTTTIVLALGLLDASTQPFDRAFNRQQGAHVTAAFDPRVSTAELVATTARRPGVQAAAGPFPTAALPVRFSDGVQDLTVVGRPGPGGPVDKIAVTEGRWPRAPGEILLAAHLDSSAWPVGTLLDAPGSPALTVVGIGQSVTRSADAWVAPSQAAALGGSHGLQMLYRFARADTDAEVGAAVSATTAGLPAEALVHAESFLVARQRNDFTPLIPFLVTFGTLGLLISVLIIANVISGAVIAGVRHIGVLKVIGFTPVQVVAIYLTMIAVPAGVGSVAGTIAGGLLSRPMLSDTYEIFGVAPVGLAPWVLGLSLTAVPLLAVAVALVPATRAGRMPAREAISAGSTPRAGRGLRVQRRLSGARLPRPISLGLGLPFARPGRAALTLAAIVLGTATVAFAVGMQGTVSAYQGATYRTGAIQVDVTSPDGADAAGVESLLRAQPGTAHLSSEVRLEAQAPGVAETIEVSALDGDTGSLGFQRVSGRWPVAAGEAVVDPSFLVSWGRSVGDSIALDIGGNRTVVRLVGAYYLDRNDALLTPRSTVTSPVDARDVHHLVGLAPGTDGQRYIAAVTAAGAHLTAAPVDENSSFAKVTHALIAMLTLVLATVAGLGVFNAVVLTTRERSRDLSVLKSIGMTPAQVIVTVVTTTTGLGVVGGLLGVPLGVAAHRVVIPVTASATGTRFPASFLDVYTGPVLAALVFTGAVIAVLGSLIPAGWAARTTIATALHTE